MTDAPHSRGPNPKDPELFAPAQRERLRVATGDLSWLLERDYALPSAAIDAVGHALAAWGVARAAWYLDQPVSNSGRLRARILERAALRAWPWTAEVVHNPDRTLVAETESVVVSGDSWVIENATRWANLVGELLRTAGPADPLARAHVADLRPPSRSEAS